jgi:hypothetical protein
MRLLIALWLGVTTVLWAQQTSLLFPQETSQGRPREFENQFLAEPTAKPSYYRSRTPDSTMVGFGEPPLCRCSTCLQWRWL